MRHQQKGRINISISLPERMASLLDDAAARQLRSRSEYVRELLRASLIPEVDMSPAEGRQMDKAMQDLERGVNVKPLNVVLYEMERSPTQGRRKGTGKSPKKATRKARA